MIVAQERLGCIADERMRYIGEAALSQDESDHCEDEAPDKVMRRDE